MSKGLLKYKRVALRLKEKFKSNTFLFADLETAIFIECGTDPRTINAAIDRMKRLELLEVIEENKREFGVPPVTKYRIKANEMLYW